MLIDDCVRHYARDRPDHPALVITGKAMTYAALEDRVSRCARALIEAGVGKGDRVAILSENHPDFAVLLFAVARCGGVLLPVNYRLAQSEVIDIMEDAGPKILVASAHYLGPVRATLPDGIRCLLLEESGGGAETLDSLIRSATGGGNPVARDFLDPVLLQYTSGTTGRPKGVLSTHHAWCQASLIDPPLKGISGDTHFLCAMPMCHTGGAKQILSVLFNGATLFIHDRFEPEAMLHSIEADSITNVVLAPTMLYRLLDEGRPQDFDLSSLEYMNIGGAAVLPHRLEEAYPFFQCKFTSGYGMTEVAGGSIAFAAPDDFLIDGKASPRCGTVGRAMIDCDIRILDTEGADVPNGTVGEICVRSDRVMVGYWNRDESPTDADGYYHTGDLAYRTDEGHIFIVDRAKDMIVSGGLNIYSREVEDVLNIHPAVEEAHVVGVPDEKWGEAVKAVIVLRPGASLTLEEVQTWCRARLASYKKPSFLQFVSAAELPRTSLGKVIKRELRDREPSQSPS